MGVCASWRTLVARERRRSRPENGLAGALGPGDCQGLRVCASRGQCSKLGGLDHVPGPMGGGRGIRHMSAEGLGTTNGSHEWLCSFGVWSRACRRRMLRNGLRPMARARSG